MLPPNPPWPFASASPARNDVLNSFESFSGETADTVFPDLLIAWVWGKHSIMKSPVPVFVGF
jgi:hypothetical protein